VSGELSGVETQALETSAAPQKKPRKILRAMILPLPRRYCGTGAIRRHRSEHTGCRVGAAPHAHFPGPAGVPEILPKTPASTRRHPTRTRPRIDTARPGISAHAHQLRPIDRFFRALIVAVAGTLPGCASIGPTVDAVIEARGLTRAVVRGEDFDHVIYRPSARHPGAVLHVYISGDGSPWINGNRIAKDPTPRNPIALRLMALDPAPVVYLGRPCFHGLAEGRNCTPRVWTSGRYSEAVTASMTAALSRYVQTHRFDVVVLIGYSGGGVLARLMAERLPQARMLVTIAANLDTDAWIRRHGYTPLFDSLNPAERPPLPPDFPQVHLIGSRDKNIPPAAARSALAPSGPRTFIRELPSDHACCWEALWPEVLESLRHFEASPEAAPPR
jgi:pimeloyl-ACP methyl ester carboxylesterase